MFNTVMPITRDTKGPPLLTGWSTASLEKLEETLKRHQPNCNYGLRLDDFLSLDPDDQRAADFLDSLEQKGLLPLTWTWTTWRGMKIRLYRRPDGEQSFDIQDDPMDLQVRLGPGRYCLIPDSTVNGGTYKWMLGRSPADLDLADLPISTLEMIKKLKKTGFQKPKKPKPSQAITKTQSRHNPGGQVHQLMEKCIFLQHCGRDRATLSEPEWYAMITQFCHLPGGDQYIHQLSVGYPQYSPEETDKKIHHALHDSPGPHTCQHIKQLYDCGKDCGVRAPAALTAVKPAHNFNLVRAQDLLMQPQPETSWIWEGILPQGGMSLLAAKPKVGKSTLSLALAVAVACGECFLGRATVQAPVIYLALEEKEAELQKRLAALNVKDEPLFLHLGLAPKAGADQIEMLVTETGAGLLVVDTLQKLVRLRDLNDYAVVTNALEPLLGVARQTNCHILLTHHAGKADRSGGDEILGSTALMAAVDTNIILKKQEQGRTLYTRQRYGEDIPETLLQLHEDFSLTIGEVLKDAKDKEIWNKMKAILQCHPEITESDLLDQIEVRKGDSGRVLRWALNQNPPLVHRTGRGKKGDPYNYFLPPLPPLYKREGEKENNELSVTSENSNGNSRSGVLIQLGETGRWKSDGLGKVTSRMANWDEAIGRVVAGVFIRKGDNSITMPQYIH